MSRKPTLLHFLKLLLAIGLPVTAAQPLLAQQNYPVKPIRLVVASSPGGGPDIVARMVAAKLGPSLGQQVIVDNKPGAGTMIGSEFVVRSPPDGYTLIMHGAAMIFVPITRRKPPYDAVKDFAPIARIASLPFVLTVHPSVPARSVNGLVALARANPDALNYASAGVGSSPHLAMELFLGMAHIKMVHIPYKGTGAGIVDLVAGQVSVMMPNILTALPHIRTKRLRALGVTSSKRAAVLPDVPAIGEAGMRGYEAVQWYGVLAPAGTPQEIVTRLNTEFVRITRMPEVSDRLSNEGAEIIGDSPGQFTAFVASENAKWTKVVRAAGIKPQ